MPESPPQCRLVISSRPYEHITKPQRDEQQGVQIMKRLKDLLEKPDPAVKSEAPENHAQP